MTGENIDVAALSIFFSDDLWVCPEFLAPVSFPPMEIVQMDWLVTEQIGRDQSDHGRPPAATLPRIKNQRIRARHKIHRRRDGFFAQFRLEKIVQLDVTDVARQALDALKRKVDSLHVVFTLANFLGSWFAC